MSMAWSLELRVPFVDVNLIGTLRQIPARLRLASSKRMVALGGAGNSEVVRERPKQGFALSVQGMAYRRMAGDFSSN